VTKHGRQWDDKNELYNQIATAREGLLRTVWNLPKKSPLQEKKENDEEEEEEEEEHHKGTQPFGACAENPCDFIMIRTKSTELTSVAFLTSLVVTQELEHIEETLEEGAKDSPMYKPCLNCRYIHNNPPTDYPCNFRHLIEIPNNLIATRDGEPAKLSDSLVLNTNALRNTSNPNGTIYEPKTPYLQFKSRSVYLASPTISLSLRNFILHLLANYPMDQSIGCGNFRPTIL